MQDINKYIPVGKNNGIHAAELAQLLSISEKKYMILYKPPAELALLSAAATKVIIYRKMIQKACNLSKACENKVPHVLKR